jgi:hypothetical protein
MDAAKSTDKIEVEPTAVLTNTQKYEVEVKTGHDCELDPDVQAVYLSIFGTASNLLDLLVDKESSITKNVNLFSPGKIDKFALYTKNVGKVGGFFFFSLFSKN